MPIHNRKTFRDNWPVWAVFSIVILWLGALAATAYEDGMNLFMFMEVFSQALSNPFSLRWKAHTPKFLIGALAVYMLAIAYFYSNQQNRRPGVEHGSAHWGNVRELNRKYSDKDPNKNVILTQHLQMSLNARQHFRNLLQIIVGGSGAGKSRSLILPNLLLGNASFIVTDPKGELLRSVGAFLLKRGYVLRVFDLIDPSHSNSYNPFRYIRKDSDVFRLIDNFIKNTTPKNASQNDPFWEKSEIALDSALMLYLLHEAPPEEQNMEMMLTMIEYGGAKEDDDDFKSPLDLLFEALEEEQPGHIAVRQYKIFKQAAGKTAKSILVGAAVRLASFTLPEIQNITAEDTLEIGKMGERKQAIFCIIPDSNDTSLNFLVGMLYTQAFQELYYQADKVHGGGLPVPVRLMFDEFANVALPDGYARLQATMRSRNMENSPFTTGFDGTITVTELRPGTYYAKEVDTGDPFWEYDTTVKKVTVAINETAAVTFTNTHYGRISFRKSTNTGNHLDGWTFRVLDSDGNVVGEFITDENGYACTGNLPLGRYTVVDLPVEDSYWNCELGFHDVTVKAGETTVDEWLNKEQGLGWFHKSTNTSESLSGWQITIYTDEACTQVVRTVTTGENGKVGYYLDPGVYYAKETGDTEGRFESEYWLVDETVQKFEIKAHEDVDIRFTNIQYGKLRIVKKVEGEGSVAGWKFKITDSSGKEIEGSPFTSLEDGTIMPPNMLPGQYTIEELIPEDSPYYCKSENPRIVTVMQGSAVEVLFTNALRSGKIAVQKVDQTGAPRAGAEFLLEWSEDGESWFPVVYSTSVLKGGCSSDGLSDGKLTSGEDGLITFEGLYHDLLYRLTETKAPEGLQLLTDYAFCGKLPDETDYVKELTVVNVPSFSLPMYNGPVISDHGSKKYREHGKIQ